MRNESNLHPRSYYTHEVARIVNLKQMRFYVSKGVYPIDMYSSLDEWDNTIIVYIFLKEETQDLYQKWLNHDLG